MTQSQPDFVCRCGWRFFGIGTRICPRCMSEIQAKQRRVAERGHRQKRLLNWLRLFAGATDRGAGDVASRMLSQAKKQGDATLELQRLMNKCSCSKAEATTKLNSEYPY